jgi:hypothetical protein
VLVSEFADADTFLERRAILVEAAKAASNCEITLEGVADAMAAFEDYKAAYEIEVAAMNATHNSATVNALATAGAAAGDGSVYEAADVIINYVDHVNK